ncbi:glycosyl transferase family 90 [Telmatospirillum sp.]|uniref:glycosyl transferase family 90 n=1 Tax=Telmatospirillum sp. TaxID=2079197 RepID=UPI00283B7CE4|nr:glycosyl transferase family 90 [Telmatospirillum sp.]MDR3439978.1 glycosyl transferase family 90 [Telmatospirillum sp.]
MKMTFIEAANRLRDAAGIAVDENRISDAVILLEQAFTAAFMDKSTTPISVKLLPEKKLPRQIASIEHVVVHVSSHGIVFYAMYDISSRALCEFRRFTMIGEIFSNISKRLPKNNIFECIIDLGDGTDVGNYRRIAYSSHRPETVLIPDPYFHMNDNYNVYRDYVAHEAKPWRDRKDVVFWRGTAGGFQIRNPDPTAPISWDWHQRLYLCATCRTSAYADRLDVGLSSHGQFGDPYWREAIERAGFLQPEVPKTQFFQYKYLIDIDGWTNSWSLLDKMIGGATILKVQSVFGYRQWYYDRLIPWENYIPISSDISDLDERISWVLSHPKECEIIAGNAASLAADIQLRPELTKAESAIIAALDPVS